MEFSFFKPKNEILRKYIESYYFVVPNNSNKELKYLTFPNNYTIVTIAKNVKEKFTQNSITVRSSKEENVKVSVVKRYDKPIEIHYLDEILEITIYFKPLGINQFNISELLNKNFDTNLNLRIKHIFLETDKDKKNDLLEEYLVSTLEEKRFPLIEEIIDKINLNLNINEIAESLNISRQYLNKIFVAAVGKTPSEYKKIHRFRKSIFLKYSTESLTEISHENDFFDQSHFIKDFKNLTAQKPSSFFKDVDLTTVNIWLYI